MGLREVENGESFRGIGLDPLGQLGGRFPIFLGDGVLNALGDNYVGGVEAAAEVRNPRSTRSLGGPILDISGRRKVGGAVLLRSRRRRLWCGGPGSPLRAGS